MKGTKEGNQGGKSKFMEFHTSIYCLGYVQWEPPLLNKLDDGKLDLIFKPFEKKMELQIPGNEECGGVVNMRIELMPFQYQSLVLLHIEFLQKYVMVFSTS
ncbi:hypothetical protein VNO77_42890 [Canavalia gladiata]|uniref:Uncharacterized protein n=1 Tax=Canavalia gladiata TaxID=3824 RepID=A0AAN9JVJ4_CANGL